MTRSIEKESWLTATGAYSMRLTRRGGITALPANALDLPEPSLKKMFNENRKNRKALMKKLKRGEDIGESLDFVRRRARWLKHKIYEAALKAGEQI